MKIIHVSDLHCHHDDFNNVALQKRIDALSPVLKQDTVLIATGDLTDDGRHDQYMNLLQMLRQLPGEILILPGNHDYGTLGSAYDPERAKEFDIQASTFGEGPFFHKNPVLIKTGNVLFILLNSCLETVDPFDFACGEIGRKQLPLLKAILDLPMNKDLVKIVALHHHPFIHSDPHMKLLDADFFLRTIYGKVDILLFGHLHEEGEWHNKAGCKLIHAADALFDTDHFTVIDIEDGKITVKRIDLGGENVASE